MLQKKDKEKILFFRESVFKVAERIFNYPTKTFHIRLLEEETGFSTTAVMSAIRELLGYKIITVEETPITTNIKADLNSESYRFYKMVFNLYRFKQYMFIDNLAESYSNPEAIVLFGSFAKGEDIEESDVDILIITSNSAKMQMAMSSHIRIFEKVINRKINFHVLPNIKNSSAEFKNNLSNGIVLHGYLTVL